MYKLLLGFGHLLVPSLRSWHLVWDGHGRTGLSCWAVRQHLQPCQQCLQRALQPWLLWEHHGANLRYMHGRLLGGLLLFSWQHIADAIYLHNRQLLPHSQRRSHAVPPWALRKQRRPVRLHVLWTMQRGFLLPCRVNNAHAERLPTWHLWQHTRAGLPRLLWTVRAWLLLPCGVHNVHAVCLPTWHVWCNLWVHHLLLLRALRCGALRLYPWQHLYPVLWPLRRGLLLPPWQH